AEGEDENDHQPGQGHADRQAPADHPQGQPHAEEEIGQEHKGRYPSGVMHDGGAIPGSLESGAFSDSYSDASPAGHTSPRSGTGMTFLSRWKFTLLLVTILFLMVVHPLIRAGVPLFPLFYDLCLVIAFLVMIVVLFQRPKSRVVALLLGIPAV